MITIWQSSEGWTPSKKTVNRLLKRMSSKGIKDDWQFCCALINRDLLFQSIGDDRSIVARLMKNKKYVLYVGDYDNRLNA